MYPAGNSYSQGLSNVLIQSPSDGQALTWNASLNSWINNGIGLTPIITAGSTYGDQISYDTLGRITAVTPIAAQTDIKIYQNQSVANNTFVNILANNTPANWQQKAAPTLNSFNTGTGVFTFNKAGTYDISYTHNFTPNATGYRYCYILWSNNTAGANFLFPVSTLAISGVDATNIHTQAIIDANVGDTVQFVGYQNSGISLTGTQYYSITWLHS